MVKISSAAAGAVVFAAAASAATINTPASITQCQPAALSWQGATGTVRLSILPGGEVSAAPIENLPDQTGASGSYVWTVNVAAGTNITITINDGSGVPNYAPSPRGPSLVGQLVPQRRLQLVGRRWWCRHLVGCQLLGRCL